MFIGIIHILNFNMLMFAEKVDEVATLDNKHGIF